MTHEKKRICPVERAGALDTRLRRLFQDPEKILKPFINPGMKVLDIGCGPGYFTLPMAKLLKNSGKVIAADLQQGMLDIIAQKTKGTDLEAIIQLHLCEEKNIGLKENVDFALAFWMVHEVPDQSGLFSELGSILNREGILLVIEPKFHVSKKEFEKMVEKLNRAGFKVIATPRVFLSRSVLLKKA
jgi:ubiquinone/menaquinone biosynthesis C-methylase UbiE